MADTNDKIKIDESAEKQSIPADKSFEDISKPEKSPIDGVIRNHRKLLRLYVFFYICTFIPIFVAAYYIFFISDPNVLNAVLIACSGILFLGLALLIRKQDLYYYKKNIVSAVLEEKMTMRKYIFDNTKTISYLKNICDKSIYPNPPEIGVSDCFKANYRGIEFSFYDFDIHSAGHVSSLNWMGQLLVMTLNKQTDALIMLSSKAEGADFDTMFTITTGAPPLADSDKVDIHDAYTLTDLVDNPAVKAALVKLKYSAQSKVTIAFSYTRLYLFMENIFDPFEPNLASHSIEAVTESLRQERELLLSAIDPLIDADIVK